MQFENENINDEGSNEPFEELETSEFDMKENFDHMDDELEVNEENQEYANNENELTSIDEIANNDVTNHILHGIELTVTCEIAGVRLSINELSRLRVGDQLPMISDLQQIRIRVNDAIIGYGELVTIDDKYGVKVNKLLSVNK